MAIGCCLGLLGAVLNGDWGIGAVFAAGLVSVVLGTARDWNAKPRR